jgi:hypothetical protein
MYIILTLLVSILKFLQILKGSYKSLYSWRSLFYSTVDHYSFSKKINLLWAKKAYFSPNRYMDRSFVVITFSFFVSFNSLVFPFAF